jgi:glutamine amidotransferase
MCRFAAFVGTSQPLSTLLFDPPHSLEHQSYAPQRLLGGHVNVDGTGVAWWPEAETDPLRYVTEHPPWSDPNLPSLAGRLRAVTAVAAVRSATPGIPFGPSNVQPFVLDRMAGVHNGRIGGFRSGVGRDLIDLLPDDLFAELDTLNDSKVLFLHTVALRREGVGLVDAVGGASALAAAVAGKRGEAVSLNIAVAARDQVVAIRSSRDAPHNSLLGAPGGGGHGGAWAPRDDAQTGCVDLA